MKALLILLFLALPAWAATICGTGSICVGDTHPRTMWTSARLTEHRTRCTADANRVSCTGTDTAQVTALRSAYDTYLTNEPPNGSHPKVAFGFAYLGKVTGYGAYCDRAAVFANTIATGGYYAAEWNPGVPPPGAFGNVYIAQFRYMGNVWDWCYSSFTGATKTNVGDWLNTYHNYYFDKGSSIGGGNANNIRTRLDATNNILAIVLHGDYTVQAKFDTSYASYIATLDFWKAGQENEGGVVSESEGEYAAYESPALVDSSDAVVAGTDATGGFYSYVDFATPRTKAILHGTTLAANGRASYSGYDVFRYGDNGLCLDALCATYRREIIQLGWWLQERGDTTLAGQAAYWRNNIGPANWSDTTVGESLTLEALYIDPDLAAVNYYSTFPLEYFAPGMEALFTRSAWNASGCVTGYRGGWFKRNHLGPVIGTFQVFCNGRWLIQDIANYGSPTAYSEVSSVPILNGHGQQAVGNYYGIGQLGYGVSSVDTNQRLSRRAPLNDNFSYLQYDLTASYNSSEVTQFTKVLEDHFYLRGSNLWLRYTRVKPAGASNYVALYNLQAPTTDVSTASPQFTITNGAVVGYGEVFRPASPTLMIRDRQKRYVSSISKGATTTEITIEGGADLLNGQSVTLAGGTGSSCVDGGTDPCVLNGTYTIAYVDASDKRQIFRVTRNTSNVVGSYLGQSISWAALASQTQTPGKRIVYSSLAATNGEDALVSLEYAVSRTAVTRLTDSNAVAVLFGTENSVAFVNHATGGVTLPITVSGLGAGTVHNYVAGLGISTGYYLETGTSGAYAICASAAAPCTGGSTPVTSTTAGTLSFDTAAGAQNPVPQMGSISPTNKDAGQVGFTLTVNGSNFITGGCIEGGSTTGSCVRWNGANRTTTFVNGGQVTAAINTADIAAAGTASVTIFNPTPGGGTSSPATFTINVAPPTFTRNQVFGVTSTTAMLMVRWMNTLTCDWLVSTNPDYSSPVASGTDSGGAGIRYLRVSGLATGLVHYYKYCSDRSVAVTGSFSTASSDTGSQTVGFRVVPAGLTGSGKARINYGTTPSLGTLSSAGGVACSSGCNVSWTLGSGSYFWQLQVDLLGDGTWIPRGNISQMVVK